MTMYATGTLPLIWRLQGDQVRYADNALAGGRASDLRKWWERLQSCGLLVCPNPTSKAWLVFNAGHLPAAEVIFQGSRINITTQGQRYLGAALWPRPFFG